MCKTETSFQNLFPGYCIQLTNRENFVHLCFIGYQILSKMPSSQPELDTLAIKNFREYLQIPSVHPDINYDECVTFIIKQAKSLDLPVKVFEISAKKPVLVITWEGTEPEKSSILLNGHMDVVPVFPNEWIYTPFGAHVDEKGNIYARGSQDMKSTSIQHIEAIRRLKLNGIRLKRTINISFMPDEEIGGITGMKKFVQTQDFKDLKVGLALDEGNSSSGNKILLSYGEKTWFQIWVHCPGTSGHGSVLLNDTAGEKLRKIIDRFMDFRATEKAKLNDPQVKAGDVFSVNLTIIKGGIQINVVPNELSVAFDIRIPPEINHQEFENMIEKWCQEAGDGIYYTIINKDPQIKNTKLDERNVFWIAFKQACDDYGLELDLYIEPGVTDARYLRAIGISAFGFSPINNTQPLAHDSNEYLNKEIFLKGIDIFMKVISAVGNA